MIKDRRAIFFYCEHVYESVYSLTQIVEGIRNPSLGFRELNKKFYSTVSNQPYNDRGIDIFSQDWDNLIILDACRYDLFESISKLEGELTKKESRGSHTIEFLHGNFRNKSLLDTVYVTASPMLYRNNNTINHSLHSVQNVWASDGWDHKEGTVLPETLTNAIIENNERFPNKRMIGHYLQPHYPFINSDFEFDKGQIEDEENHSSFWKDLIIGDLKVDESVIWEAYVENLKIVLEEVDRLLDEISGKTVITADHGNMVGERSYPIPIREYGHPIGTYTPELVEIPWFEPEFDTRRKIKKSASDTLTEEGIKDRDINEKLKSLGYI